MNMLCKVMLTVCCVAINAVAHAEFKVGFSKVDITPKLGTPLSGHYSYRPADGVLDSLHARCVAMSDGAKTALIFSIDNLQIGDTVVEMVKSRIFEKTKITAEAIFLACTHIHTGPACRIGAGKTPEAKELVKHANEFLAERCAEASVQAIADMVDTKILIGRGEATDISFIRRYVMKDGTCRTNPPRNDPNVVGPIGVPDESLQLVRFVRNGAKEIALVNFQCHPDVIAGTKYSSDWPGLTCSYLEAAFNDKVSVIFINGAQGDTNHHRQRWKKGDPLPQRYEMSHHMARTVAGGAMKAWGFCREVPAGKINAAICHVKVNSNKAQAKDYPLAEKWNKLYREGKKNEIPGIGMERTVNIAWAVRVLSTRSWPDEKEIPVTVISVGRSLAFGGFPGEPFTEMGLIVKRKSKFAMTIPACCTGGSYGYFPMKDAFTVGGYENATSRYAKGSAERLVAGMLAQLDEFYGSVK